MDKDPIQAQIKQSMDALKNSIDVQTQVKLNEARHTALNKANHMSRKWLLAPITGIAAVFVLAFAFLYFGTNSELSSEEVTLFEDLELLANEADTEFYQDLDFLTWLDENELMESDI
jgi:type VI protein secretion system component VasF